jgi:hypothetical protein
MDTTINVPANWAAQPATQAHKSSMYTKFMAFADGQSEHRTMWFYVSMVAQGVFLLPVPAALMYYYNAPIIVLIITLFLYFANIISGMGGAGTRVLLSLFALSVLIHIVMVAIFVI